MQRLPTWIRRPLTTDREFAGVHTLVARQSLHTVCESAKCPNRHECWNKGTATIMILGDICTRSCRFCAVKSGRPKALDTDEPRRVAEAVASMKLRHVVLTSVDRDDLHDGGSIQFAETIRAIKKDMPEAIVEVLTSDFEGSEEAIDCILDAGPEIFSHNLETVAGLQPVIRPQASYGRSLAVLRYAAQRGAGAVIKSGLMVGLGETDDQLLEAMTDLREAGCELLTVGQYLCPTKRHAEVKRFVPPETFDDYARQAKELGFAGVASGPMVRSSYKAEELYAEAMAAR